MKKPKGNRQSRNKSAKSISSTNTPEVPNDGPIQTNTKLGSVRRLINKIGSVSTKTYAVVVGVLSLTGFTLQQLFWPSTKIVSGLQYDSRDASKVIYHFENNSTFSLKDVRAVFIIDSMQIGPHILEEDIFQYESPMPEIISDDSFVFVYPVDQFIPLPGYKQLRYSYGNVALKIKYHYFGVTHYKTEFFRLIVDDKGTYNWQKMHKQDWLEEKFTPKQLEL